MTGGAVLVDGVDVREMDREDLWRRIGFVPQKSFLFSGTIASNLRYGDEDATDQELWRALDIAQASDFVAEMDRVSRRRSTQGGTNVSGGQRQRLAIARALVKRAPVYVFDDSFSALDFRTDARLRAALKRELADATVIIVAQRVGTIMNADRIVVLDEGRVVGIGTHNELLATNETYREIVYSQLTGRGAGGMSGPRAPTRARRAATGPWQRAAAGGGGPGHDDGRPAAREVQELPALLRAPARAAAAGARRSPRSSRAARDRQRRLRGRRAPRSWATRPTSSSPA